MEQRESLFSQDFVEEQEDEFMSSDPNINEGIAFFKNIQSLSKMYEDYGGLDFSQINQALEHNYNKDIHSHSQTNFFNTGINLSSRVGIRELPITKAGIQIQMI